MKTFKQYLEEAYPPNDKIRKEIDSNIAKGMTKDKAFALGWAKHNKTNLKINIGLSDDPEKNPYYRAKQGLSS